MSQTQTSSIPITTSTFNVEIFNVEIKVDGYIKVPNYGSINNATIFSPYRFKGWLKSAIKQYLLSNNVPIPCGPVKGGSIIRCIDYPEQDRGKFLKMALSPISQLFGFPIKNASWFGSISNEVATVISYIMQPPRINIKICKTPRIIISKYVQGVRDDINNTVTENPHEIVLVKLLDPITISVSYRVLPFDRLTVPEYVIPQVYYGQKYFLSYPDIIEDALKYIVSNNISPFGGRALHQVTVTYNKTTSKTNVPAIPQFIQLLLHKYLNNLPKILSNQYNKYNK